jgi:hypothetical protein
MKTVIEMAREAGFHSPVRADGYMGLAYDRREGRETGGSLERFAGLVRADAIATEREACAKVCDVLAVHPEYASEVTKLAAMAIRNRSNK